MNPKSLETKLNGNYLWSLKASMRLWLYKMKAIDSYKEMKNGGLLCWKSFWWWQLFSISLLRVMFLFSTFHLFLIFVRFQIFLLVLRCWWWLVVFDVKCCWFDLLVDVIVEIHGILAWLWFCSVGYFGFCFEIYGDGFMEEYEWWE